MTKSPFSWYNTSVKRKREVNKMFETMLSQIQFNVQMWWESKFNRKNFGYSYTFGKNGYFIKENKWFVPCDKSFSYGCVDIMTERKNGNPFFEKS